MSFRRLVLVASAAVLWGQSVALPAFDAASVKRNPLPHGSNTRLGASPAGYSYIDAPLSWIVAEAYGLPHTQVVGPGWIETECYDVITKAPPDATREQRRTMLQTLLAERFHMVTRRETRDTQVLVMTVGNGGPKMKTTDRPPTGYRLPQEGSIRHMVVPATMKTFAPMLAALLHEPVVDHTGLDSVFAIDVAWDVGSPTEAKDELIRGVQEQLGLKLERKKIPLDVVVLDRADKAPVEN